MARAAQNGKLGFELLEWQRNLAADGEACASVRSS